MSSNRPPPRAPPKAGGGDPETGMPRPAQSAIKRKTSKNKRDESAARRARTASDGSTFKAFFANQELIDNAAKEAAKAKESHAHGAPGGGGLRKRRSSHRKPKGDNAAHAHDPPPQNKPLPSSSHGGSDLGDVALGDVATMAMIGLGDDVDFADLMGGGAPPPAAGKPKNRRREASPPPTGDRNTTRLPTIMDDSEQHHDLAADQNHGDGDYFSRRQVQRKASKNKRSSVNSEYDDLRVSEMSAGMADDVAGALTSLDRDNSMYLSEASDVGGFVSQLRADKNGPLWNNSAASFNTRASLLGSDLLDSEPPPAGKGHVSAPSQEQEIASFAAMLHQADYGAVSAEPAGSSNAHPFKFDSGPLPVPVKDPVAARHVLNYSATPEKKVEEEPEEEEEEDEPGPGVRDSILATMFDPTHWLMKGVKYHEEGYPYFEDSSFWSVAGIARWLFFNPIAPEFSSLQQFDWAVVLGVAMGFYTAFWKEIIEKSVEFMWKELPESLLDMGLFTDLDGSFPLYHYMWMCPAFWGGLLSYIFAVLPTPIPGQNEWIQAVHTMGVQDSTTFFQLFVLATLGMASGLSLGPELPLILTSGMIGSWLGLRCKQSILQARVMNITCASAAIGGFFGFPMAGALFVLEVPHRMGLQYFEALSPATIASIVAVLCNRLVTGNDVTGYYSYPFLTTSLPSSIFTSAIVFGVFGAVLGTVYVKVVLQLKGLVHDFFHEPHDNHEIHDHEGVDHDDGTADDTASRDEKTPLMVSKADIPKPKESPAAMKCHHRLVKSAQKIFCCVIPFEPYRAAASGVVAGAMVGVICMFLPHVMFWGEAQLQTLIDKGRTPLPIFGQDDEPTAALTALSYCLIDPDDAAAVQAGFGMRCSLAITFAKIVTTGLSLGTGIIGGHFWGPLFAGCAFSHFITGLTRLTNSTIGFGGTLAAYPCVTILCTMGSAHVVTFRAHTAIMLILTLTISAFDPEDSDGISSGVAGDYSAVFPLLVISVFVALMLSRETVFYASQRSRVDIMALPEVLCEPGKEGNPMVMDYDQSGMYDEESEGGSYDDDYFSDEEEEDMGAPQGAFHNYNQQYSQPPPVETKEIYAHTVVKPVVVPSPEPPRMESAPPAAREGRTASSSSQGPPRSRGVSPLPPRPEMERKGSDLSAKTPDSGTFHTPGLSSSRLDELLAAPIEGQGSLKAKHRRIQSAPDADFGKKYVKQRSNVDSNKSERSDGAATPPPGGRSARHARSDSYGSNRGVSRITTIGQLSTEQPSLMDQARGWSASSVIVESRHNRTPSMPSRINRRRGHSRGDSLSSIGGGSTGGSSIGPPMDRHGVPAGEAERAFSSMANQDVIGGESTRSSREAVRAFASMANPGNK